MFEGYEMLPWIAFYISTAQRDDLKVKRKGHDLGLITTYSASKSLKRLLDF
jgi:hypothetical protein